MSADNDVMTSVQNYASATDPNDKRIAELEERRAARRERNENARKVQRALDLEAVDCLEESLGPDAVVVVECGRYIDGLPTLAAFRLPRPVETKRFYDRIGKEKKADPIAAGEELAASCREYPAKSPEGDKIWASLCDALSQLKSNCGVALVKAAKGVREDEGKE